MVNYVNKQKSKWLGYTGEIKGGNVNTFICIVCGKELTQREYLEIVDMCRPCKRKAYSRGQHRDKLRGGNNDIDKILIKKMEETN